MSKIIILPNIKLCPYGNIIKISCYYNKNLCDILLENNINIDHYCEKFGKCTTCSVIIKEGYFYINEIEYEETEIFKNLYFSKLNLRLSCQVFIKNKINLIIEIL